MARKTCLCKCRATRSEVPPRPYGHVPWEQKINFFSSIFQKSIQTSRNHVKTFKRYLKHPKKRSINLFCTLNSILTPDRALKANSSKSLKTPKIMGKTRCFQLFSNISVFSQKKWNLSSETCKTMSELLPDRFSAMVFWKMKKNRFFGWAAVPLYFVHPL